MWSLSKYPCLSCLKDIKNSYYPKCTCLRHLIINSNAFLTPIPKQAHTTQVASSLELNFCVSVIPMTYDLSHILSGQNAQRRYFRNATAPKQDHFFLFALLRRCDVCDRLRRRAELPPLRRRRCNKTSESKLHLCLLRRRHRWCVGALCAMDWRIFNIRSDLQTSADMHASCRSHLQSVN